MANILIIDHDAIEAAMEEAVLEQKGYTVHVERDGAAALASIAARWPRLVVLDPNHEVGVEAVHAACEAGDGRARTPLLLVSNPYEGASLGGDALAEGALVHPFTGADLTAAITKLLEG